jgi:hypothetical protein
VKTAYWSEAPAPNRAKRKDNPVLMPVGLFGATFLLILVRQGHLLQIFFPVGSLCVGALLYRRYPAHYVGFLCWLFFLTPEVRRFADYFNGVFNPTSSIQLAPLLVAALSGLGLLRHCKLLAQRRSMPIVMILLGIIYAYCIGAVRNGPLPATYTMVSWIFPVLIAFHMLITWRLYPDYQRVLMRTFVWGTIFMGIYGIFEFVVMPPWDAFWMINANMSSEGNPVPFGMRVSSTMNSAGPFAVAIMTGLLFTTAASGLTRLSAGVAGFCALLLTFVRGGWGAWVIGMAYTVYTLNGRARLRIIISGLLLLLLLLPLAAVDRIATPILARLQTIGTIQNDSSYNDRAEFYRKFLTVAVTDIAGQGLGSTGQGTKLSGSAAGQENLNFDSGLMEIPYVMGWPGTMLFGGGLIWIFMRALSIGRRMRDDKFVSAGVGVSVSIFALLVFVNTVIGSAGLFFYIGVMLPAMALRHAREMKLMRASSGA